MMEKLRPKVTHYVVMLLNRQIFLYNYLLDVYTVDGVEFVHKAAENLADKKLSETLREKLSTQKEKRKIQEKIRWFI